MFYNLAILQAVQWETLTITRDCAGNRVAGNSNAWSPHPLRLKVVMTFVLQDLLPTLLDTLENQSCDTVFCALGKECVMKDKEPVCECIEKCQGPLKTVCGSDGTKLTTYDSECHLYKAGCESKNITITMVAEMSCEEGIPLPTPCLFDRRIL